MIVLTRVQRRDTVIDILKIANSLSKCFSFFLCHFVYGRVTKINYIWFERGKNFLSIDKKIIVLTRVQRRDIVVDKKCGIIFRVPLFLLMPFCL